jgi:hypothetical protein
MPGVILGEARPPGKVPGGGDAAGSGDGLRWPGPGWGRRVELRLGGL